MSSRTDLTRGSCWCLLSCPCSCSWPQRNHVLGNMRTHQSCSLAALKSYWWESEKGRLHLNRTLLSSLRSCFSVIFSLSLFYVYLCAAGMLPLRLLADMVHIVGLPRLCELHLPAKKSWYWGQLIILYFWWLTRQAAARQGWQRARGDLRRAGGQGEAGEAGERKITYIV